MIKIDCENIHFTPPKTDRCFLDDRGVYTLVLQNNYTKEVFVYKVHDGLESRWFNPLRFAFTFPVREGMRSGEYAYFVCSFDKWCRENVDKNIVEASYIREHDIALFNGIGIINHGFLLVERSSYMLVDDGEAVSFGRQILTGRRADECEPYGDLYRKIEIICSGIVKLNFEHHDTIEYESARNTFIQPQ